MIFNGKIEISVRIRKNYYLKFKDFTIRAKSQNNGTTEIHKLKNGLGKIYFYAWLNDSGTKLADWIIVNIEKIRNKLDEGIYRKNIDETAFLFYSIDFLKKNNALIMEYKQPMQTLF
jgi:hypothetical protein